MISRRFDIGNRYFYVGTSGVDAVHRGTSTALAAAEAYRIVTHDELCADPAASLRQDSPAAIGWSPDSSLDLPLVSVILRSSGSTRPPGCPGFGGAADLPPHRDTGRRRVRARPHSSRRVAGPLPRAADSQQRAAASRSRRESGHRSGAWAVFDDTRQRQRAPSATHRRAGPDLAESPLDT